MYGSIFGSKRKMMILLIAFPIDETIYLGTNSVIVGERIGGLQSLMRVNLSYTRVRTITYSCDNDF